MGNEASKPSTAHTHGGGVSSASDAKSFATVDVELRRKFGQGLTYNMKVVIRGDRNTGKTNLFRRLQQQDFTEEYIPTKEIQVGTIHWNYKVTDDVVKVEVWDVVDSANNRLTSASVASSLRKGDESDDITISQVRESASPGRYQLHALDANTVDVYKGCHAVLMVVDPTKKWTFEYAQEHIPLIPEDIEVAIIANSRDLYTRWAVSSEEMRTYVDSLERRIHFFETSMVDGFGISSITSFLNIPFLKIQRHVFVQKLEKNKEELDSAFAEVALMSKEQNYAFYLKWLEQKKESKLRKPSVAPASRSGSVISMPSQTDTATLSRPSIEVSKSSSVQKQDQSPSVSSSPENPKASIDLTKPQQSTPTAEVLQSKVDEPSPQQLAKDHEPVNTAPTDTTLAVQDQKEKQQQSAKPNQVHETQEQVARALTKPADSLAAATKNDLPPSQIAVPLASKSSSQTPTTTTTTTPVSTPTPTPQAPAPKTSGLKAFFSFKKSTPQQEKPKDEPKLVVKKEGISLDTFDTGELDENFFSSEDDGEEDDTQESNSESEDEPRLVAAVDVDLDDEDLKQVAPRRISSVGSLPRRDSNASDRTPRNSMGALDRPVISMTAPLDTLSEKPLAHNTTSLDDFKVDGELEFSDDGDDDADQGRESSHEDEEQGSHPHVEEVDSHENKDAIEIVDSYEDVASVHDEQDDEQDSGAVEAHVSEKELHHEANHEQSSGPLQSVDDFMPEGELEFSDDEKDDDELGGEVAQQPQKTVAIEEKMPPIISEAEMQRAELSEFKASSKKDEKKSKEKKSKKADENLGIVEEKPKKKKTKEANQDTSTHAEDEVQEKKKEKDKTKTKTKTGDKKKSKEVLLESVEKSGAYADFASLSGDEQHTTKAKKEKKSAKLPRGYEDFSEIAEPALETLESTASAVVEKKKKKKSKEAVDVDESTPQLQVDEGEKAKKKKKAKDEATVESKTEKKEKRTKKNADPVMGETSEKSKVKGKKKAQVQETIADSGDELDDFYADVE
eukprot:TRINITY_DN12937_c0_g1_i1.p1 TRINITY_DN12937_c0_g1~~TRINITY_DN12937_c0_g1_i1.p1  ORF type:complete len:1015 (-),score=348.11 TRINITY_DN12937_c0_g1_i1:166-3210(-)